MFFDWLGMNAQAFNWLMDYHFGMESESGSSGRIEQTFTQLSFLDGYLRTRKSIDSESKFILIGKGLSIE
jgi:hypothetical protein